MDEVDRDNDGGASDGRVHPVGQALRSTFGADNHDSLGSDLTGLMIDLSRVPFDAADRVAAPVIVPQARPANRLPQVDAPAKVSGLRRLVGLFRR